MRTGLKKALFFFTLFLFVILIGKSSISAAVKQNSSEEELKYIRLFMEAYQLVKERYVEEKSPKVLFEGAIQGMLNKLDPHCTLFTPDQLKEFQIETSGEFGGLGIQITKTKDGKLLIITPIEDLSLIHI